MLESLRHDAVTDLGGVLSGFWSAIEEQVRLAALAGHDYVAAQEDRVAVMALSQRALELATRFRESVEREFARWERPSDEAPRDQSLSLMSEGELEAHLAGQQIAELLDHQFLHPLAQLDERLKLMASAMGLPPRTRPNPLRPETAVAAFVALFGADDLTPSLRSTVFHQFDKRLPKVLGDLYGKANATLDLAGFNPMAPQAPAAAAPPGGYAPGGHAGGHAGGEWMPDGGVVPHTGGGRQGASGGGGYAHAGGGYGETQATARVREQMIGIAEHGRPMRYRDLVRDRLRAWRSRESAGARDDVWHGGSGGDAGASDGGAPAHGGDGHVLAIDDLLNIATLLQGDDPKPFEKVLAGEDERPLADVIRHELLSGVSQIGFDPAVTHFSSDEEDVIDLIGILFQSLSASNHLMDQSRQMYGRLVVPYLKVALTDDSLFNRRSHPARRLLDAVSEACDGNAGGTPQDQETLNRAERAVDKVVDEYQDDQAIFELAASELRDYLDQQRRRAELAEKRTAEAIHGRERLRMARNDADGMVASRLAERPLTPAVAYFIDRHWRHHLIQTWLRDGPESQKHRDAITVGDAMLQVDADASEVRGAFVADQLLALQVPLCDCYSSCGLDAAAAHDALARIVGALAMPDTPRKVHVPQGGAVDSIGGDGDGLKVVAGSEPACDPSIVERMRRLRVGQGLRMIDGDGVESAGRIAWVSPLTARFLVVDRRGARRMVVSPEELAVLVADGRVQVRSVEAPFDAAMKRLWQYISDAKPDDPVAPDVRAAS